MRVLYNNLIETAQSLAMTNLDNDSVVEYLYDPYIELACYCTATTSVITGSWIDAMAITCMAIGYHNADFARLILKDVNGDEILNHLFALELGESIYYLTAKVEGAYSFEAQISGGEPLRVGFLGFGACLELPRFETGFDYGLVIGSTSDKSKGGQIAGVFARPLRAIEFTVPRISNSKLSELFTYLSAVQTCKPHMIDLYPAAHGEFAPMYANISKPPEKVKKRDEAGFFWTYTIAYEEAR